MAEFFKEWWDVLAQAGIGGFACLALWHVWNRLVTLSDKYREMNSEREKAHRAELLERDDVHRQEMKELQERHDREKSEIVARNMDEHRERNRVQTKLAMAVARAYALNGDKAPDPYPDVDGDGRRDPRA